MYFLRVFGITSKCAVPLDVSAETSIVSSLRRVKFCLRLSFVTTLQIPVF